MNPPPPPARMPALSPLSDAALVVASTVLYILCFPNGNHLWLAWVALAPLAMTVRPGAPGRSFAYGWLAGTAAYAGLLSWLVVTFQAARQSVPLALLSLLFLSAYLGLFWGIWTLLLSHWGLDPRRVPDRSRMKWLDWGFVPLAGAAVWVALEYARTYLFSGFPWTLIADTQVKAIPLIQIASLTGAYGVSFLLVAVNLAIASWRLKAWGVPILLVGVSLAFGAYRLRTFSQEPLSDPVRVALLQGSIDQYKKWDQTYVREIQDTYAGLVAQAKAYQPAFIVWPETSVPGYLLQEPQLHAWLVALIRQSATWHLLGAPILYNKKAYNQALSLNHEGILVDRYAKQHLVPFGEIVPWSGVLGRLIGVLNELGGFTAGEQSPVVQVAGIAVGVNICYEAIFPDLVRRSVKDGAELIANLTNDGWYMRTAAPYQHWAPNIFRAVENRRWLVRANNTGVTGIVDPAGRVQAASPLFQTRVVEGTVEPRSDLTVYTRWGDVFAQLCVLLCAVVGWRDILRRRSARRV